MSSVIIVVLLWLSSKEATLVNGVNPLVETLLDSLSFSCIIEFTQEGVDINYIRIGWGDVLVSKEKDVILGEFNALRRILDKILHKRIQFYESPAWLV